jgi:hypothetical protein
MHMQRTVGNAAVGRMLQRETETPAAEAEESTGSPPDYSDIYDKIEADAPIEKEYEAKGQELLEKLKDAAKATGSGGDSGGKDSPDYPEWFNHLQQRLVISTGWTEDHEAAQKLLYKYAVWKETDNADGKLNPALENFFRYIGRSAANREANAKYKEDGQATSNAGELGAGAGYAWCANATSSMFIEALKEKGLRIKGGFNQDWFNKYKHQVSYPASTTDELKPGDQISFSGKSTPVSGHVATVIEADGDTIKIVSGNAGGTKGGSIRIEQVVREAPPSSYKPMDAINGGASYKGPKQPSEEGVVWVFSIVKLSKMDLSQIDVNDDALLEQNGLARLPVSV